MKVRSGFVSNSSSSSFMGGIGVVIDFDKFEKWVEKLESIGLDKRYLVLTGLDSDQNFDLSVDDEHLIVYLPVNSEPSVYLEKTNIKKINNNKEVVDQAKDALLERYDNNVVFFSIGNDEGDSMFSDGDYDLDYDIDLDFFPDEQQKLYNEFGSEESGVSYTDKTFGAGRNG